MICKICDRDDFKSQKSLLCHLRTQHNYTPQQYYDLLYPNSGNCKICGKSTSFDCFSNGYKSYCSSKCAAQSEITKQKRANTNINKYGYENISQIPEIKEQKVIKYKENLKDIQEKVKATNRKNYGVDWITQSDNFKIKAKETCIKRYGEDNYAKTDEWLNNFHNKMNENVCLYKELGYIPKHELIIKYGNGWYLHKIVPIVKYKHKAYVESKYIQNIQDYYKKNLYKNRSHLEDIVIDYIKSIYNGKITLNTRRIIAPYEIDIYLDDLKLGIEVNGIYRHSKENGCPKDYHLNKAILCQNQGIRLYHIYEFDINDNWEVIKEQLNKIILQGYNIIHTDTQLLYQNDKYSVYGTNQQLYKERDNEMSNM